MSLLPLVAVVAPRSASAEDDLRRAREEFDSGVQAARRGDYQRALFHYRRSYEYRPHPRTMFNLAAVADQLQRDDEAYEAYQNFLRTATEREKALIADAEKRVAELEVKLRATLALSSIPGGAKVYVDGSTAPAGTTPCNLRLPPGDHQLVLEAPGHFSRSIKVKISPQGNHARSVQLVKRVSIRFRSNVPDARISVDNHEVAGEVVRVHEVVPGQRRVVVERAGYQTVSRDVSVGSQTSLDIDVHLHPERSRRSKLVWASIAGLGLATAATGAIGWGIPAIMNDDGDKAWVADRFYIAGGAVVLSAVVGWYLTSPDDSELTQAAIPRRPRP
jgi:hypothetical protein